MIENGTTVAMVDLSLVREAGELTIQGSTYRLYREGLMSGAFILESGGSILARAVKPSALYRSFQIEYDGRQYTLEAKAVGFREFVLSENGVRVGSIYPEHALTRKSVIDFPETTSLPGRIFMFSLVMLLWKRASDAAS